MQMQWFVFTREYEELLQGVFADLNVPFHRKAETGGFQEAGEQGAQVINPPLVGETEKNQRPGDQHRDRETEHGRREEVELLGHKKSANNHCNR